MLLLETEKNAECVYNPRSTTGHIRYRLLVTKIGMFYWSVSFNCGSSNITFTWKISPLLVEPGHDLITNMHTCMQGGESWIGSTEGGWKFPDYSPSEARWVRETSSHSKCVQFRTHRTCKYDWFLSHAISVKSTEEFTHFSIQFLFWITNILAANIPCTQTFYRFSPILILLFWHILSK